MKGLGSQFISDKDMIKITSNKKVKKLFEDNKEKFEFATPSYKINDKGKKQERNFVITSKAFYNFDKEKYKWRKELEKIEAITLSTTSTQMCLHISLEKDYHYECHNLQQRNTIVAMVIRGYVSIKEKKMPMFFREEKDVSVFIESEKDKKKGISHRPPIDTQQLMQEEDYINYVDLQKSDFLEKQRRATQTKMENPVDEMSTEEFIHRDSLVKPPMHTQSQAVVSQNYALSPSNNNNNNSSNNKQGLSDNTSGFSRSSVDEILLQNKLDQLNQAQNEDDLPEILKQQQKINKSQNNRTQSSVDQHQLAGFRNTVDKILVESRLEEIKEVKSKKKDNRGYDIDSGSSGDEAGRTQTMFAGQNPATLMEQMQKKNGQQNEEQAQTSVLRSNSLNKGELRDKNFSNLEDHFNDFDDLEQQFKQYDDKPQGQEKLSEEQLQKQRKLQQLEKIKKQKEKAKQLEQESLARRHNSETSDLEFDIFTAEMQRKNTLKRNLQAELDKKKAKQAQEMEKVEEEAHFDDFEAEIGIKLNDEFTEFDKKTAEQQEEERKIQQQKLQAFLVKDYLTEESEKRISEVKEKTTEEQKISEQDQKDQDEEDELRKQMLQDDEEELRQKQEKEAEEQKQKELLIIQQKERAEEEEKQKILKQRKLEEEEKKKIQQEKEKIEKQKKEQELLLKKQMEAKLLEQEQLKKEKQESEKKQKQKQEEQLKKDKLKQEEQLKKEKEEKIMQEIKAKKELKEKQEKEALEKKIAQELLIKQQQEQAEKELEEKRQRELIEQEEIKQKQQELERQKQLEKERQEREAEEKIQQEIEAVKQAKIQKENERIQKEILINEAEEANRKKRQAEIDQIASNLNEATVKRSNTIQQKNRKLYEQKIYEQQQEELKIAQRKQDEKAKREREESKEIQKEREEREKVENELVDKKYQLQEIQAEYIYAHQNLKKAHQIHEIQMLEYLLEKMKQDEDDIDIGLQKSFEDDKIERQKELDASKIQLQLLKNMQREIEENEDLKKLPNYERAFQAYNFDEDNADKRKPISAYIYEIDQEFPPEEQYQRMESQMEQKDYLISAQDNSSIMRNTHQQTIRKQLPKQDLVYAEDQNDKYVNVINRYDSQSLMESQLGEMMGPTEDDIKNFNVRDSNKNKKKKKKFF